MNLVTLPDHLLGPNLVRRLPSTARAKDWTGYRSAHFEVLGFAGFVNGLATYLCRCDCGEAFLCVGIHIPRRIKCGICRRTHHKPARAAWKAMHQRWGKNVVNAWCSFDAFYASMGARPSPKHVVVRIDTRKKFGANNCRWSTEPEPRKWLSARFRQIRLRGHTLPRACTAPSFCGRIRAGPSSSVPYGRMTSAGTEEMWCTSFIRWRLAD